MAEAMARQLVPSDDDAPHELGMPLRHPPEDEEGCLDVVLGQNLEETLGIAFDPARQAFPIAAINRRCECFDLKIILDVDRHRVGDAAAHWPAGSLFDLRG